MGTSKFDSKTKMMTLKFEGYVFDSKKKAVLDSFYEVHKLRTFSLAEIKRQTYREWTRTVSVLRRFGQQEEVSDTSLGVKFQDRRCVESRKLD